MTIGFFTGGGGFAVIAGTLVAVGGGAFSFMGPLFATLAAPFIVTNLAGAALSVAGLVGFTAVMTPLILGNNLKRFIAWVYSFIYDAAAEIDDKKPEPSVNWTTHRTKAAEALIKDEGYPNAIGLGIESALFSTYNSTNNKVTGPLTSPDAEKLEMEKAREKTRSYNISI